jgi:hypothetical protein
MPEELVIILKPLDTSGSQVRLGLVELSCQAGLYTQASSSGTMRASRRPSRTSTVVT